MLLERGSATLPIPIFANPLEFALASHPVPRLLWHGPVDGISMRTFKSADCPPMLFADSAMNLFRNRTPWTKTCMSEAPKGARNRLPAQRSKKQ
jgi:hypothetical protein